MPKKKKTKNGSPSQSFEANNFIAMGVGSSLIFPPLFKKNNKKITKKNNDTIM